MGGVFMLGISEEVRSKAGVAGGDTVDVDVELDTQPRDVEVPPELAKALAKDAKAKKYFEGLSYSGKIRLVAPIANGKTPDTREREMEVSIEPDQRPAFPGLGQRHVLLVGDPKWQVDHQVSPSVLRVDVAHVDPHRPLSAEAARRQVDHLSTLHRSSRHCRHKASVLPLTDPLDRGQDAPDPLNRCRAHRRGTDVDDHSFELKQPQRGGQLVSLRRVNSPTPTTRKATAHTS